MEKASLYELEINSVLKHLHEEAKKDFWKFSKFGLLIFKDLFTGKRRIFSKDPRSKAQAFKDIYISVGEQEGKFLYLIARSIQARNIIEFGTSFGISTIYLAAAVKDNGGGKVISTEIEPEKVKKAREHVKRAGLDSIVEIRLGDATETLQAMDTEIDMIFFDGWKHLYLPLVKQLSNNLHSNSIVIADDVSRFKKSLIEYINYMNDPSNGFISVILPIGDGMQYSIKG